MADVKSIKQRFGIIGDSPLINRAIDIACQVAPVNISVLILGESGVGKEFFPKIIHDLSPRKHKKLIAVNCGAIPEGTIDSELFGHEKGSFTGAHETRKGYFEEADGGTIFLDEVAELPLATQARLLRVLESGEFIKVGSSKVEKTDVRIVAATNVNFTELIQTGRFRQDLYYRLNTVPIYIPPLRDRKEDIYPIFRRFTSDFAEKNKMPSIVLTTDARALLENYRWEGNVRQLKNISEQISIIEKNREISAETLKKYLPEQITSVPTIYHGNGNERKNDFSEREILYKILFDMKNDINELRSRLDNIIINDNLAAHEVHTLMPSDMNNVNDGIADYRANNLYDFSKNDAHIEVADQTNVANESTQHIFAAEVVDEPLSLVQAEKKLIKKALDKYKGNRKKAAKELEISERTLYRKIDEYGLL